ncbi:MAG TPA: outer membrane lipoprotein-sorting protein [Vicinamibacteria bacterium]|nr:outer membrane lipoprotein-sorting protein [Vicinamibacteria bacterium]
MRASRTTWRAAAAAVVSTWSLVASAETVDEILARNAAARGGLEAWRAVTSMRMAGQMDVGRGMRVPFRLEQKRPRKMRLEFEFDGTTAVQAFDGSAGWKRMPFLGRDEVLPFSEAEARGAAGQVDLDGPLLDCRARGESVELLGQEKVEGRDAFKLKVATPAGLERVVYVDVQNGLEVRVESAQVLRGGEKRVDTFFRDYREVQGLLIAHVVESRLSDASVGQKLAIESVQINPRLDDARFDTPAPPRPVGSVPKGSSP